MRGICTTSPMNTMPSPATAPTSRSDYGRCLFSSLLIPLKPLLTKGWKTYKFPTARASRIESEHAMKTEHGRKVLKPR